MKRWLKLIFASKVGLTDAQFDRICGLCCVLGSIVNPALYARKHWGVKISSKSLAEVNAAMNRRGFKWCEECSTWRRLSAFEPALNICKGCDSLDPW